MGETYRASAIFPEITFSWLSDELETGDPGKRETDPYIVSEEDKAYILSKKDFWLKNNMSAIFDEYLPEGYKPRVDIILNDKCFHVQRFLENMKRLHPLGTVDRTHRKIPVIP